MFQNIELFALKLSKLQKKVALWNDKCFFSFAILGPNYLAVLEGQLYRRKSPTETATNTADLCHAWHPSSPSLPRSDEDENKGRLSLLLVFGPHKTEAAKE